MKQQPSPPAGGCTGGEAVASLKTWSDVTFQLLFPVASGIDGNTGNLGREENGIMEYPELDGIHKDH